MKSFIEPGEVNGTLHAPPSKSAMQRALFAASLAEGESRLYNLSHSADCQAARRVIETLGAELYESRAADGTSMLSIRGGGKPKPSERDIDPVVVDCGEAGLTFRVAISLCARFPQLFKISGQGSLLHRPLPKIGDTLKDLGVEYRATVDEGVGGFEEGTAFPPVYIRGPIKGGRVEVDGSLTSQFISGLLMVLPTCTADSELSIRNAVSHPYLRMTVNALAAFGVQVSHSPDFSTVSIAGGQRYSPTEFSIEGDWSGASVLLSLAAIGGEVTIEGLTSSSCQADVAILQALRAAGAVVRCSDRSVYVSSTTLHGFEFDATNCPDLFPALVVLAAKCRGKSRLMGASRLFSKESNRAVALVEEGLRVGLNLSQRGDIIEVHGGEVIGGVVSARGDHRIAMAFAALGCVSDSGVTVEGSECVSKSYPNFFEDLARIAKTKSTGGVQ